MDYAQLISNLSLSDSSESHPSSTSGNIEPVPPKLKKLSLKIDSIDTEILYGSYEDAVVLIASQFEKLGTIYKVTKDLLSVDELFTNEILYTVKCLFGVDDIVKHTAARFIAERLSISDTNKPLILSICLKDYSPEVLKAIALIVNGDSGDR